MNFNLKAVNYNDNLSEETPCFSAEIWQDGRLMAYVTNRGHGGSNEILPANGLTYKDVAHYDNIEVESRIFEMVYDDYDRKRLQGKNLVLKKDGKIFTQTLPMPIRKLKSHPNFKSWKLGRFASLKMKGYEILNTNL